MYHTPMYSEIVKCDNCGKEYDNYCPHICKIKKKKRGEVMTPKTKRLKGLSFEFDSESNAQALFIEEINGKRGSDITRIVLNRRRAAALRDFLNQQELPITKPCYFNHHFEISQCPKETKFKKCPIINESLTYETCPYGRKWKGDK